MKIEASIEDLTVWHAARGKWGKLHEVGMATEELAETITAINHMIRDRPASVEEFIGELADSTVCCFQIIENNGWWDEFHEALAGSFTKLHKKLIADNKNEGHT